MRPELPQRQLDLFRSAGDRRRDALLREVAGQLVDSLTPVEALVRLQELKDRARELLGTDAEG